MEEEVTQRTIALSIRTAKLTGNVLRAALRKFLAAQHQKGKNPPKYLVFFKGRDTDVLNQVFKEYVGKQMKQKDKPSIMEKLTHFKEVVAKGRNWEQVKEYQKDRGRSL